MPQLNDLKLVHMNLICLTTVISVQLKTSFFFHMAHKHSFYLLIGLCPKVNWFAL